MKKHLKVLKIEREGNQLEIWIKGNYNKMAKYYEKKFYDEYTSFLGTYIDVDGKYIILRFVLRNLEDILPYIKYSMDDQVDY